MSSTLNYSQCQTARVRYDSLRGYHRLAVVECCFVVIKEGLDVNDSARVVVSS
jgi:hypothetical protein